MNSQHQIRSLEDFVERGMAAQKAVDQVVLTSPSMSLTSRETERLSFCEGRIERGLDTFIDVGQAMLEIRDSRLYRQEYDTFDDYCRKRWALTARHAHRLIDSAQIAQNLLPPPAPAAGDEPAATNWSAPANESQLRPLKGLEPQAQRQIWEEANKSAGAEPLTARHVEEAREKLQPKKAQIEVMFARVDKGGDIDSTNCHDLLASSRGKEPPVLKKAFGYNGDLWVVSIGHFGGSPGKRVITQEAHRLLADDWTGKETENFAEGRFVSWKGQQMRLGPTVLFQGFQEHEQEELEDLERGERAARVVQVEMDRADGGDIDKAYSGDLVVGTRQPWKIRKPFEFEGKLWTVLSGEHGRHVDGVIRRNAYELIAADAYAGPEQSPHHYEGATVCWKQKRYRLGPMTVFRAKEAQKGFELETEKAIKPSSLEVIQLKADQLLKDAGSLRDQVDHCGELSTRQLLHLSVALTHLKNFRGSLDQQLDPRRKAEESRQQGNARARKTAATKAGAAAARWTKAKAKAREPQEAQTLFVIKRELPGGAITFRTERGGWTPHPNNAKTFPNATAAKFACHHSGDRPIMLHRAQGLRA